jgi:hypothetical protein
MGIVLSATQGDVWYCTVPRDSPIEIGDSYA